MIVSLSVPDHQASLPTGPICPLSPRTLAPPNIPDLVIFYMLVPRVTRLLCLHLLVPLVPNLLCTLVPLNAPGLHN